MHAADPPEVLELFERIVELRSSATSFDGTIIRSVGTKYSSERDFLSGAGASFCGGRWNRRGIVAVYASLDIETAVAEAFQNFLSGGFSLGAIRPRTIAGAKAKLQMVLDLTDPVVRRRLGFRIHDLLDEDWQGLQAAGEESWTQAVGRGCRLGGFEAMLVPSARRSEGTNIVIFPDKLILGSELMLLGMEDLPPHPSTWPL